MIKSLQFGLLAAPFITILQTPGVYASPLSKRFANGNEPFTFKGCYHEPPGYDGYALKASSFSSRDMTTELCASFCADYKYFGTEWGRECFCDDYVTPSIYAAEGMCTTPCAGDRSQTCGGDDHLYIYVNNKYSLPPLEG